MWLHIEAASSGVTKRLSGDAMRYPPEPNLPPTATLKPFTSTPADFFHRRRQCQVLSFGMGADFLTSSDGDVEFSGQIRKRLVAD